MYRDPPNPYRQISTLVLVLSLGVSSAFFLAAFLAYQYGPSGQYLVRNALIEPSLIKTLSYNDTNRKTGSLTRFVFNGIEFSHFDSKLKRYINRPISLEEYESIYELIRSDRSLDPKETKAREQFVKEMPAALSILVRTESHAEWIDETKTFQRVEFTPLGDYYRIELREEPMKNNLVYFYHPKIFEEVQQILFGKP